MTSQNLCEPNPILAPLGEILCEPRRLWRHGSRAPATIGRYGLAMRTFSVPEC